jgi:hypothetical protein
MRKSRGLPTPIFTPTTNLSRAELLSTKVPPSSLKIQQPRPLHSSYHIKINRLITSQKCITVHNGTRLIIYGFLHFPNTRTSKLVFFRFLYHSVLVSLSVSPLLSPSALTEPSTNIRLLHGPFKSQARVTRLYSNYHELHY